MHLLKILLFAFLIDHSSQSPLIVVKDNGDELQLTSVVINQGTSTNKSKVEFTFNGNQQSILFSDLKRINLKDAYSKKKGVTTWNALLIKKDNQKMEIQIPLVQVIGMDKDGDKIQISSGLIDKISF